MGVCLSGLLASVAVAAGLTATAAAAAGMTLLCYYLQPLAPPLPRVQLLLLLSLVIAVILPMLSHCHFALRTCMTLMFSLWPRLITSSKAKMRSKAALLTASSSSMVPAYSGTSFDSSRSVSRSSRILLPLLVTSSRNMPCRNRHGQHRRMHTHVLTGLMHES